MATKTVPVPEPPDDEKPWTPLEISMAQMVNRMEEAANGCARAFNELTRAWDESVRRETATRAARREKSRRRFDRLRQELREGKVPSGPS